MLPKLTTILTILLMSFTTTALSSPLNPPAASLNIPTACNEGQIKCLAANDNGKGGGIFECVNGYWKLIVQCRDSEKCVERDGRGHCQW